MYNFLECIDNEIAGIRYLMKRSTYDDGMKGTLVCRVSGKDYRYYLAGSQVVNGKRIRPSTELGNPNDPKVLAYKRNRYNKEMSVKLQHDLELLLKLKEDYLNYDPETIYQCMPAAYRDVPTPHLRNVVPRELTAWAKGPYEQNMKEYGDLPNLSAYGNPVRSKGEIVIYNQLDFYGVPYRKEEKLKLIDKENHVVYRYPDVKILTITGRPIWWEHHGRLDKDDYMRTYLEKCELYYNNGLYLGDNLIVTVDRPNGTMNAMMVDQIIRGLILPQVTIRQK